MNKNNFFSRALRLAESVKGLTSPNPAVGCVIVAKGRVVGRGATQKAGRDHAEIVALRQAGRQARGADLFVTLEPCVDYPGKKTVSCANAIIRSGIRSVTIGARDPNPRVNGRGITALRKAGVQVHILNGFRDKIQKLNEDFEKYIRTGFPFVIAKAAMTLDGNTAASDGESRWISGPDSRRLVHTIRNRVDAVMVGVGTVLKDNPRLDVRLVKKLKNPLRVIVDPDGRTPRASRIMRDRGRTLFIVRAGVDESFRRLCARSGKQCLEFPAIRSGRISLRDVVRKLGSDFGIESVLIEGGGRLLHSALSDGVVDKLMLFVAAKVLGGIGMPLFNGPAIRKVKNALTLNGISVENMGNDILIQGYLKGVCSKTENSTARAKFPSFSWRSKTRKNSSGNPA